jgi:cell division control protein 6
MMVCVGFISNSVTGNTGIRGFKYSPSDCVGKMGNRFSRETLIIENKDVLRDDWQPDKLVEREEELDAYTSSLTPVIRGWQPNNVFLYGVTGSGKTVATRQLLTELFEESSNYDDVDLNIVEVNCKSLNSSYQVAVNLVNEIRNSSYRLTTVNIDKPKISETGYPQQRVFDELYSDIEEVGGTVLFVLDEIDNIGASDDILYELPRARSTYDLDAKVGVIGISNDFKFRDNLSSKVKDTLCEEEIMFRPYDATELSRILNRRIKKAFVDDEYIAQDVIPLCAAFAAQDSGSARQALRLLRKSGDIAEQKISNGERDDLLVTEEDVREGEKAIHRQQVIEGMNTLTRHGHFVLLTVCELASEEKTPARTKMIHKRYRQVANDFGSDPLKRRRVHDHLSDLSLHSILQKRSKTEGRGNYNEYELDVQISSVIEVLENEFKEDSISPIRARADMNGLI